MKIEGVALMRTPTDCLFVLIDKERYPDIDRALAQIVIRYGLPLPDAFGPDEPKHKNWGVLFTVPEGWWQLYVEDYTPCPDPEVLKQFE